MPSTHSQILQSSVVAAAKDQVSSNLADEVIILGLKSGVYYGLNPVGARIWNLIQTPNTFEGILESILDEYEVERGQCEQDIRELLEKLLDEGLLEVLREPSS